MPGEEPSDHGEAFVGEHTADHLGYWGEPLVTDISENTTNKRDDGNDGSRFENLPFMGDGFSQKIEAPSLSPCLTL